MLATIKNCEEDLKDEKNKVGIDMAKTVERRSLLL